MNGKNRIYYPGVYNDEEKALFEKASAQMEAAKGRVISKIRVDENALLSFGKVWDGFNPMYFDAGYAKNSVWKQVVPYPGAVDIFPGYPMLDSDCDVLGNYFYYGIEGGMIDMFQQYVPGEEYTVIQESQQIIDTTDPEGSIFRRLKLIGTVVVKDKDGKPVSRVAVTALNGAKTTLDGTPPASEFDQCFEYKTYANPLTPHVTTDEEWERIEKIWAGEKVRGAEPLYWEDVEPGTDITPTSSWPISPVDMIRFHGDMIMGMPNTREMLASGEAMMVDPLGCRLHMTARHYYDCHVPDNGALYYNHTARNLAIRAVTNWMGDAGFISKYGWIFCNYSEAIYDPDNGKAELSKVPYLSGRAIERHGMEGDTTIGKAYIYNKYKDASGCYVELMCWGEDLEGRILTAVPVTVRLPSREA